MKQDWHRAHIKKNTHINDNKTEGWRSIFLYIFMSHLHEKNDYVIFTSMGVRHYFTAMHVERAVKWTPGR